MATRQHYSCGWKCDWRVRAAVLAALFFQSTAVQSHAADEFESELNVAITQLQEWRQSFATIRVVWHSWNYNDFVHDHPGLDPDECLGKTYYSEYEFAWADIGAFKRGAKHFKDGRVNYRDALGSEGTRPWHAETRIGKSADHFDLIQIEQPDPSRPLRCNLTFDGLYGLWNSSSGSWIGDRLKRSIQATVRGFEELDGARCLVVVDRSEKHEEVFWLDIEHSYLPRQLRFSGLNAEQKLTPFYTWRVNEYQLIDDRVWFPMSGTFLPVNLPPPQFQWVVRNVVLNEPMTRADFAPPIGTPGVTRVIDRVGRTTALVGQTAVDDGHASNQPDGSSSRSGGGVAASPASFSWHSIGLMIGLLLILAACLGKLWLRRQTS